MSDQQTQEQGVIRRVLNEFKELRRKAAVERHRARAEEERWNAEVELVIDDVKAEGLHEGTPEFYAAVYSILQSRRVGKGNDGGYEARMRETSF